MSEKELYKILDILIDEIDSPYFQDKARKILVKLIIDEENKKRSHNEQGGKNGK